MPRTIIAAALLAAAWATCAHATSPARFQGEARLSAPLIAPLTAKVAGVTWTCAGDRCAGTGPGYSGLDDRHRECRQLAAALGPLAGFKSRGRVVTGWRLAACNTLSSRPSAPLRPG